MLILGGFTPIFCQKSVFGLGGVKFFTTNLDHLLGLNFPESLSSIGLMVEAVDTFRGVVRCWCGAVLVQVWVRSDYTENLSQI